MKKSYRGSLIAISCLFFSALAFPAGNAFAQAKRQAIVNVTAARVRTAPDLESDAMRQAGIGEVFDVLEETGGWRKVKLSDDKTGWISKTVTEDFATAARIKTYNSLADKYLAREEIDFRTAAEVYDFLNKVALETRSAALELKKYKMLDTALRQMPFEKLNDSPYKDFTDRNAAEVVYSEPAGQWYVSAGKLWQLHAKHRDKPLGEEIAWQAAKTNLPGECEGYINCYVYILRAADGEYLKFYPSGKHSREALENITNFLEPISADAAQKSVYTGPVDISDRAELNKNLAELRLIISKTPYVEKQKTIRQINRIAEAFR